MRSASGSLKRPLCLAAVGCVLLLATVAAAPGFLSYADQPVSADVIVLFVGPENSQRRARALALLGAGYAGTLFIPAHRSVVRCDRIGDAERTVHRTMERVSWLERNRARLYPPHVEQTHMEILIARDFMAERGFRTAIFVSSPYHMRRIRAITLTTIPGAAERIRFVAARSKGEDRLFWFMNRGDVQWVWSEYLKLCWFWLYRPWMG